jgi:hypothetical protein
MKGPGNRLKSLIRRQWQCPHCRRIFVTPGSVTAQPCTCRPHDDPAGPVWMQLTKDPVRTPTGRAANGGQSP